jgi:hypothetical protein
MACFWCSESPSGSLCDMTDEIAKSFTKQPIRTSPEHQIDLALVEEGILNRTGEYLLNLIDEVGRRRRSSRAEETVVSTIHHHSEVCESTFRQCQCSIQISRGVWYGRNRVSVRIRGKGGGLKVRRTLRSCCSSMKQYNSSFDMATCYRNIKWGVSDLRRAHIR